VRKKQSSKNYRYALPAELTFFDKYGWPMLIGVFVLLFVVSLVFYLYLQLTDVSLNVTETIYDGQNCTVIVLHQGSVRPGQVNSPLIVKVIPHSTLTTTLPVTITVTELNPEHILLQGEHQQSFVLPSDQAQMRWSFDVLNSPGLPNESLFQVTAQIGRNQLVNEIISIAVAPLSAKYFAFLSLVVTGALSVLAFIAKQLISNYLAKKTSS